MASKKKNLLSKIVGWMLVIAMLGSFILTLVYYLFAN